MKLVFRWNIFPNYTDETVTIFLIFVFVLMVISLILGKNKIVKWIILSNVASYIFYYFAVKVKVYAMGIFGERYNLFFIPVWIIMIFAVCFDVYSILSDANLVRRFTIFNIRYYFVGICICIVFCYGVNSWTTKLQGNWVKENNRGAVNAWYDYAAFEKNTIVYYATSSSFYYYLKQNEDYNAEMEQNIDYMLFSLRDADTNTYTSYIHNIYGNNWPEEVYVIATHFKEDLNTFLECFTGTGYIQEDLYNKEGGRLIHLVKAH